jgi:hypothetical protein
MNLSSCMVSTRDYWAPCLAVPTFLLSGRRVFHACFGRAAMCTINGKEVKYYIQPRSRKEIGEWMFKPIRDKPKLCWTSFLNNLKLTPQRAPIAFTIYIVSGACAYKSMAGQYSKEPRISINESKD